MTHFNPDTDAIASAWLIRRFFPGWEKASFEFVPAGETFRGAPVDSDPEIIHVDTGRGKFDHHQKKEFSCASLKVLKEIEKQKLAKKEQLEALQRLVTVINEIDNGRDILWPEADSDHTEFMPQLFLNYFNEGSNKDKEKIKFGLKIMEMVYLAIKQKVKAEKDLSAGREFETRWGKAIALETENDDVLTAGEKKGYCLVAKIDPKSSHLRIYSRFDKKVDLTRAFDLFKKADPQATWYLHPSKCLLLNGSRHNPKTTFTKLPLEKIIALLQKA